jgi:hypothetical protein
MTTGRINQVTISSEGGPDREVRAHYWPLQPEGFEGVRVSCYDDRTCYVQTIPGPSVYWLVRASDWVLGCFLLWFRSYQP